MQEGNGNEQQSAKCLANELSGCVEDKPLWLEIVRFLDTDDLDRINTMPELEEMGEMVTAERETLSVLRDIVGLSNTDTSPYYLFDSGYATVQDMVCRYKLHLRDRRFRREGEAKLELSFSWWFRLPFSPVDYSCQIP